MVKIRVLLADDHAIVRQGIRVLVEAEADITVVGEAENGRQAVQMTTQLHPDVVVMDLAMPLLNGLEATRQIMKHDPNAKVLVLSSYSDREYVHQLTEVGAAGYLLKQTAADDLIKAVREARKGNAFFTPTICRRLVDNYRNAARRGGAPTAKRRDVLTTREAEVLQLIAEGKPNKQIAAELDISIKTVEKHRQQVMYKLDIHDIAGLTRYAMSRGIIESGVMAPLTPHASDAAADPTSAYRQPELLANGAPEAPPITIPSPKPVKPSPRGSSNAGR
jgi:DNA-binding NarL/FixJ family response regulator